MKGWLEMKNVSRVLPLLLAALLSAACTAPAAPQPAPATPAPATTAPAAAAASAAPQAQNPLPKPLKDYVFGYVQAGIAPYYQTSADGFKYTVEQILGAKVINVNSDFSADKEVSNVEDLIAQKVDAIVIFTNSGDSAQQAAQLCNKANIPVVLIGSAASDGPGKVDCTVKADFQSFGKLVGDYVAANFDSGKIGIVEGASGQNICEPITQGFKDGIASKTGLQIVSDQPTDWSRQQAMAVAQNILTANPDLSIMFVHNEDMAQGALQAITEANMQSQVALLSTNGSPDGLAMIDKGDLRATAAESPSQEAAIAAKAILDVLAGKTVQPVIDTPMAMVDKASLATNQVTWSTDACKTVDFSEYLQ